MVCSPALTGLANQAPKTFPQAKRAQIIDRGENYESHNQRQPASECPILRPWTDRASPSSLDSVEQEMSAIQHRDWQQVDESEIN